GDGIQAISGGPVSDQTVADLEQLWRRKSDLELHAASRRLHEYSEASQRAIKGELERRKSADYLRAIEPAPAPLPGVASRRRVDAPIAVNSRTWVAQRALLAAGLMIGFYLFALAVAAALLWIPYAEVEYLNRVDPRIAIICLGSALTILWSLL